MNSFKRSLHFCFITTFYPPYHFGGDAIFVHRLANQLAKRNHQVDVIHCLDAYFALGGKTQPHSFDNHPNVRVHSLQSGWRFVSPLSTLVFGRPFFKRRRIRSILEAEFDVIHYHNISLIGGPQILEYGNAVKLYTPHEYWLACPTSMLYRFNHKICLRKSCLVCSLYHGRPPQLWRYSGILRRALKHVDAFLSLTKFSESIHRREGLDLPYTHLPFFAPSADDSMSNPMDRTPSQKYFLYVGRLEKLKGVQTLIPIFRQHAKAQLLIAGTGSMEPRLRHMARGCSNIKFMGNQSYSQLKALYRNAIAVIVPSLFYEVSPLVVIEAALHKTPIIARNIGSMPEILQELGSGITFDTDKDLVAAMDRLGHDAEFRDELGDRGYAACQEKYGIDCHLDRYLSLIDEIKHQKNGLAS